MPRKNVEVEGGRRLEKIAVEFTATEPPPSESDDDDDDEMKRKLRALKTLGHDDEAENRAALQTCGGRLRAARRLLKTGQLFQEDEHPSPEVRDSTATTTVVGASSSTNIPAVDPQETLPHTQVSDSSRDAGRKKLRKQGSKKRRGKKKRRKKNATPRVVQPKPLDENTTPFPSAASSRSRPNDDTSSGSGGGAQVVSIESSHHESGQKHQLHGLCPRERDSFADHIADHDDGQHVRRTHGHKPLTTQSGPCLHDASLALQDGTGGPSETAEKKRPPSRRNEKKRQKGGSMPRTGRKRSTCSRTRARNPISPTFPKEKGSRSGVAGTTEEARRRLRIQGKHADGDSDGDGDGDDDSLEKKQQIAVAAAAVAAAELELKNARAALKAACAGGVPHDGSGGGGALISNGSMAPSASNSTRKSNSSSVDVIPAKMPLAVNPNNPGNLHSGLVWTEKRHATPTPACPTNHQRGAVNQESVGLLNRQQLSPRKQEQQHEGNLGWVFRTQVRPFLDARAAAHLSVRQSE